MTKIYDLTPATYNLYEDVLAEASVVGTFVKGPACSRCKESQWERISPLVIEWEEGSDVIADFTWPCGLDERVVTQKVKDCLDNHGFIGVSLGPVEMFQNPKLKKPARVGARNKKRIWLPYEGPRLWDLSTTSWCNLDVQKSKRTLIKECDICHRKQYDVLDGAAPLVVDPKTWDGSEFFKIRELGDLVFVLEKVKKVFEKAGFANVKIEERGRIGP
jgi:hypothetical protein